MAFTHKPPYYVSKPKMLCVNISSPPAADQLFGEPFIEVDLQRNPSTLDAKLLLQCCFDEVRGIEESRV